MYWISIVFLNVSRIFLTHHHLLSIFVVYKGPICRFSLKDQKVFNISYSLEEAVHFYRMNKSPYADDSSHITVDTSGEEQNEETMPRPSAILALILATVSRWNRNKPEEPHQKKCGHSCYLRTTISCCSCTGKCVMIIKVDTIFYSIHLTRPTTLFQRQSIWNLCWWLWFSIGSST